MLSIALIFSVLSSVSAQVDFFQVNKKGSNYRFTTEKQIAGTNVKKSRKYRNVLEFFDAIFFGIRDYAEQKKRLGQARRFG